MSRAFEGKGNDRKLERRQLKFSPSNYLLMSLESMTLKRVGVFIIENVAIATVLF